MAATWTYDEDGKAATIHCRGKEIARIYDVASGYAGVDPHVLIRAAPQMLELLRSVLWHPVVYAVNFALIPYCVLRDFDSPPKPRWMKWISIETQVFGERDMKGSP